MADSTLFALVTAAEGGEAEEVGGGDGGGCRLGAVVILLLAQKNGRVALRDREVAACGAAMHASAQSSGRSCSAFLDYMHCVMGAEVCALL